MSRTPNTQEELRAGVKVSDTPRTDEQLRLQHGSTSKWDIDLHWVRQLERELAAVTKELEEAKLTISETTAERDALLQDKARLDWLEQRGLVVWHDGQTLRESIDAAKEVRS